MSDFEGGVVAEDSENYRKVLREMDRIADRLVAQASALDDDR
jgi:hypothetical protein